LTTNLSKEKQKSTISPDSLQISLDFMEEKTKLKHKKKAPAKEKQEHPKEEMEEQPQEDMVRLISFLVTLSFS